MGEQPQDRHASFAMTLHMNAAHQQPDADAMKPMSGCGMIAA